MNRLRVGLILSVLGASTLAGCGSSTDEPQTNDGLDLEARLLADTGVAWIVDRDDTNRPLFLTAPTPPPPIAAGTTREAAALAFLQRYASTFNASEVSSELVLVRDAEDPMAPGVHHLRFAQRIPGSNVRAFGADTFAHFDANGSLRSVAIGMVSEMSKISPTATRTADEAVRAAEASVRARDPQAAIAMSKGPTLVVHRAADRRGTLAWRVVLTAQVQGALEAPEIFVDASSLAIVEANDTAAHATAKAVPNVYYYHSDCGRTSPPNESTIEYDDAYVGPLGGRTNRLYRAGVASSKKSTLVTDIYAGGQLSTKTFFTSPTVSADPSVWDILPGGHQGSGAAVSTHENLQRTDAFFAHVLGQRGWDDVVETEDRAPNPIRVAVHAWTLETDASGRPSVTDIDGYLDEVIYLGDGIVAGAPLGSHNCDVLPSGVALDIVAHEFTHGVVAFAAKLGTEGEAGAINEAIADVLGAATEHSVAPGPHNYIMGEDSRIAKGGVRSMKEPRRFPAHLANELIPRAYSERLSTAVVPGNDRGHTHDNSVILSHAFFLMNEGGRNEKSGRVVPASAAMGWKRSQFLWYLTLHGLDRGIATRFHDFARVNTNQAIFFGDLVAVACAWRAVEVFTDAEVKAYGVSCDAPPAAPVAPPASGPENVCAGHGSEPVCDRAMPNSAAICRNGVRIDTAVCADPHTRCKVSGDADPRATLDPDGALLCE